MEQQKTAVFLSFFTKELLSDLETASKSISMLKENAPGDSDIPAKAWKAFSEYEETFAVLKFIILNFWKTELTPSEW